jgi:hypothetical protein
LVTIHILKRSHEVNALMGDVPVPIPSCTRCPAAILLYVLLMPAIDAQSGIIKLI